MKTLATAALTLMVAGAACGQFKAQQTSTAGVRNETVTTTTASLDDARRIPRDEAIRMVREGKAVWVDVRSKADYDAGHIKGAMNVPLAELQQRYRELPMKKFLITYCA